MDINLLFSMLTFQLYNEKKYLCNQYKCLINYRRFNLLSEPEVMAA